MSTIGLLRGKWMIIRLSPWLLRRRGLNHRFLPMPAMCFNGNGGYSLKIKVSKLSTLIFQSLSSQALLSRTPLPGWLSIINRHNPPFLALILSLILSSHSKRDPSSKISNIWSAFTTLTCEILKKNWPLREVLKRLSYFRCFESTITRSRPTCHLCTFTTGDWAPWGRITKSATPQRLTRTTFWSSRPRSQACSRPCSRSRRITCRITRMWSSLPSTSTSRHSAWSSPSLGKSIGPHPHWLLKSR